MNFLSLDVETANSEYSSICQIGIVTFCEKHVSDEWQAILNPECTFSKINTHIHGIKAESVTDAQTFTSIYPKLKSIMTNQLVASYSAFDRNSIEQACHKYDLPSIECAWLDITRVVRSAWIKYSSRGYGLKNVAKDLGLVFAHHNALEDARIAGIIFLKALEQSCANQQYQTVLRSESAYRPTANMTGHLYGQTLVFTGELSSMSREKAKELVCQAGCVVKDNITQKTTILVTNGIFKGSKYRKAEEFIQKGIPIQIIDEAGFLALLVQ